MSQPPKDVRPKRFPPPEFPPRRPKLFATTPPAIFPPLLGLIGLGLALRRAAGAYEMGADLAELALGLVLGLWVFAVVAIKVKLWRRLGVLAEDLRPLPGRAGMAAGSMSGMAVGALLVPYAPGVALVLVLASLVAHGILAGAVLRVMAAQGAEGLVPNPTWHLGFTGIVVAVVPLAALGYGGLALGLAWAATVSALAIWAASLWQLWREVPPAPLRPLLAIHLAPAALLSLGFGALGQAGAQLGFLGLSVAIAVALVASGRWILASGFSPMWGAITFPLAALAQALLAVEPAAGLAVTAVALVANPWIFWRIWKLWPGGKLAARTHAAEA